MTHCHKFTLTDTLTHWHTDVHLYCHKFDCNLNLLMWKGKRKVRILSMKVSGNTVWSVFHENGFKIKLVFCIHSPNTLNRFNEQRSKSLFRQWRCWGSVIVLRRCAAGIFKFNFECHAGLLIIDFTYDIETRLAEYFLGKYENFHI